MTVKDIYDRLQTLEDSRDKDVEALCECFESLKLNSDRYDFNEVENIRKLVNEFDRAIDDVKRRLSRLESHANERKNLMELEVNYYTN